jgi:cation diffusion facilitator CzcD-associated flavoprotein CzcO
MEVRRNNHMSEQTQPPISPWDSYNQILVSNVHPADWKNPTPAPRYNLVVIGGGTAGLVSAVGAAGLGAKVALIEKHFMGGDCLNVGCVPSKAMTDTARRVTPAQIAALKNHFDDDGVVALTAWIAFQNLSAKFNSALGAEENGLCQLPGKPTGPN